MYFLIPGMCFILRKILWEFEDLKNQWWRTVTSAGELSHQKFVQIQSPETQSTIRTMAEVSASDSSWATRWPQQSAWTNDRWMGDEPAPDTSINIIPLSYPLANCPITMERSTIFHGKIHYFYGHFMIIPLKTPRLPGCPFDPPWLHHDAPPARTNPPAMPAGNGCLARWRSQMGWKMVKNSAKNQNTVMIICVLKKGNTRWCPIDS